MKVQLVQRLVSECGFSGVVFESQFYDMLNLEHSVAAKTATREQVSDAIGALWSRYAAFVPLEDWLVGEAATCRVRIAGMDPQAGGVAGHYSQTKLAAVLSSVLSGTRRAECERTLQRHDAWAYDDAHPFDAAALLGLRACIGDVRQRLASTGQGATPDLSAMAASYAAYLQFADGDPGGLRDRAMYDNVVWIRAHWPKGTRIVIWCASAHAAKTLEGVRPAIRPLGSYIHEAFGDRAAAIGFSALGGSYGNVGGRAPAHVLDSAVSGSLEARAFAGDGAKPWRFLDREQLHAMGEVSARALDYSESQVLDWSHVVDGMIVLRTETAAQASH
ncbi:MAG: erythromycin esterase family protein [Thermomonas sp.]